MMYGEMMLGLPSTPGAPLVRLVGREGGGAWMEPAPEQREVEGRGGAFFLVRGAPLASYGLVAHFPSCSPVVVVDDVAHVFEQRLTRLAYVLVRVCLRVRCLSVARLVGTAILGLHASRRGDERHHCRDRCLLRRTTRGAALLPVRAAARPRGGCDAAAVPV